MAPTSIRARTSIAKSCLTNPNARAVLFGTQLEKVPLYQPCTCQFDLSEACHSGTSQCGLGLCSPFPVRVLLRVWRILLAPGSTPLRLCPPHIGTQTPLDHSYAAAEQRSASSSASACTQLSSHSHRVSRHPSPSCGPSTDSSAVLNPACPGSSLSTLRYRPSSCPLLSSSSPTRQPTRTAPRPRPPRLSRPSPRSIKWWTS